MHNKIINNPLSEDLDHILTHTKNLWEDLRGKRLFITGGTGFFGCWFLESFAWANEKLGLNASMHVLTRNMEAFKKKAPHLTSQPSITFYFGDVRSFDFPKGEFPYIIHAAASLSSNLNGTNLMQVFDTIVEGARHTLEFATQCKVKKFLLISSGAVYGKQPFEITHIPEDYQGAPNPTDWHSIYGEGKRVAELLCTLYARQFSFDTMIARCFSFVGPYQTLDAQWAMGNFIRDGLNGGPILVKGDGTPYRSYLYAADLIIFLLTILFKGESCLPYNVGSDLEINIQSLAKVVSSALKMKKDIVISKRPGIASNVERYVPSTQRIQEKLDLKQEINLQDAIKRTINYIKFSEGNR